MFRADLFVVLSGKCLVIICIGRGLARSMIFNGNRSHEVEDVNKKRSHEVEDLPKKGRTMSKILPKKGRTMSKISPKKKGRTMSKIAKKVARCRRYQKHDVGIMSKTEQQEVRLGQRLLILITHCFVI